MSKIYYRTQQMIDGKGFRCYNCNQKLISKIDGSNYEITLTCRRCHAEIKLKMREAITFDQQKNSSDLIEGNQ